MHSRVCVGGGGVRAAQCRHLLGWGGVTLWGTPRAGVVSCAPLALVAMRRRGGVSPPAGGSGGLFPSALHAEVRGCITGAEPGGRGGAGLLTPGACGPATLSCDALAA